jgi:hypothetical protein
MFTSMTNALDKCVWTLNTWLIHERAFNATYYVEVCCYRYLITGLLRGLKEPLYIPLRTFLLQVCTPNFGVDVPFRRTKFECDEREHYMQFSKLFCSYISLGNNLEYAWLCVRMRARCYTLSSSHPLRELNWRRNSILTLFSRHLTHRFTNLCFPFLWRKEFLVAIVADIDFPVSLFFHT